MFALIDVLICFINEMTQLINSKKDGISKISSKLCKTFWDESSEEEDFTGS